MVGVERIRCNRGHYWLEDESDDLLEERLKTAEEIADQSHGRLNRATIRRLTITTKARGAKVPGAPVRRGVKMCIDHHSVSEDYQAGTAISILSDDEQRGCIF